MILCDSAIKYSMLLRRIARFFILTLLSFIFLQTAVAKDKSIPQEKWQQLEELKIFQKAYPDIKFIPAYDKKKEDWLVRVIIPALKETKKRKYSFTGANQDFYQRNSWKTNRITGKCCTIISVRYLTQKILRKKT